MKWLIRFVVGGAHAAVILVLLVAVFGRTPVPPGQKNTDERSSTADKGREKESARTAEDAPRKETVEEDRQRWRSTRKRLLAQRLRRSLPDELGRQAEACRTGVVIDLTRKQLLWEKQLLKPVPVASLTKMMTVLLLLKQVEKSPAMTLETDVDATEKASKIGGSQVYLDPRERLRVEELVKCMLMFSANDVAYLTAQFVTGGDVEQFVDLMNRQARRMNLESLNFVNPHGLPPRRGSERNRGNILDMSLLGAELLRYPAAVKWASTWVSYIRTDSERFDRFQLVNRNSLVHDLSSVTGMKTGYTDKAGFCIVLTAEKQDRVVVVGLTGCPTQHKRNKLAESLLKWAYKSG